MAFRAVFLLASLGCTQAALGLEDDAALFQIATRITADESQLWDKMKELQQAWREHVEERIPEIEAEKLAKHKQQDEEARVAAIRAEAANQEDWRRRADEAAALAMRLVREAEEEPPVAQPPRAQPPAAQMKEISEHTGMAGTQLVETHALSESAEAKNAKYGEEMMVVVKTPLLTANVSFRRNTKLQVLMHRVCHQMQVNATDASLYMQGRLLDPRSTVEEAGLKEGAVVELDSPELRQMLKDKKEADQRAIIKENEDRRKNEKFARERKAKESKKQQAIRAKEEEQRLSHLEEDGRVPIKFVHFVGSTRGKEIQIALRSNNWFKPTMEQVCRRLEVDPAVAGFFRADKLRIKGEDSVASLKLKPMDEIIVHTPGPKPPKAALEQQAATPAATRRPKEAPKAAKSKGKKKA